MTSKLIQLEDGTLVEIETSEDQVEQISGGFARKSDTSFDKIQPILIKVCRPVTAALMEINLEAHVEQADIELGLSFDEEGNIYVAKSRLEANVVIKLAIRAQNEAK